MATLYNEEAKALYGLWREVSSFTLKPTLTGNIP